MNSENHDYQAALSDSSPRRWSLDMKEKLLIALVKTFSLNMPLYVTYKHLLFNHGRYAHVKNCSCSKLSNDSIALLQLFCQTNSQIGNQRSANNIHVILIYTYFTLEKCYMTFILGNNFIVFSKEIV